MIFLYYEVFLIHPEAQEIDGERCYPDLAAVRDKVDGVLVSLPANQAAQVMGQAVAAGISNVWLQQGAETPDLRESGRDLGLNSVSGKSILMYAPW